MSIWTRCRGAVVRIDDPGDNNFRSGRAAVEPLAGTRPQLAVPITNFLGNQGTIGCAKTETCTQRRSLFRYERVKYNHSGIHSGVWHFCFAWSEPRWNFGADRNPRRDVAGGKSVDRTWLGQLGECAPAG